MFINGLLTASVPALDEFTVFHNLASATTDMDKLNTLEKSKHLTGDFRNVRIVPSYESTIKCSLKSEDIGRPVLETLCRRFPFRSEDTWRLRLQNGWVKQHGQVLAEETTLESSEPLYIFHPRRIEPSVPDELRVLEKTDRYLLIYKPAPMPIHPGGRYYKNTVTHILEEAWPEMPVYLTHRLDAVTSGLLLLARCPDFLQKIHRAFANREVEKKYLAVVKGNPVKSQCTIRRPIKRKQGYLFECANDGHEAITHFEVLERGRDRSLVLCTPETGRTHQIRLHLKEWGHPIYNDYSYLDGYCSETPRFQNNSIALIHHRLAFPGLSLDFSLFQVD
ncbi:RNA pseudouridine synthase [Balneolaceae bacterium ANBcel3]|nr:RNA pseudouridine synthase [Balneolaceae bacterium ANBcel3]